MTKIIVYIIKPVNAHRAPNVICLILCFYRSILVTFCVLLQTSSVSEAQMLILKRNILHDYWLFCNASVDSSRLHFTFVAFCHFVCHSLTIAKNNVTTMLTIQSSWPDSGQILHHQYGISVVDAHCLSWQNIPSGKKWRETAVFAGYPNSFIVQLDTTSTQSHLQLGNGQKMYM